jgi:alpha/beta superfamily hydrolase
LVTQNRLVSESKAIFIDGPVGRLEASIRAANDPRAVVVLAHPHPLYGGTLHNPVIFHADRELNRRGSTTLRFNFRGVGASDGVHDNGLGEVHDLGAAVRKARELAPAQSLFVAGYSFGSRCAVTYALSDASVAGVVVIGLPVRLWPFDDLASLGRPLAVVQGTADEFGSIGDVEAAVRGLSPPGKLYPVAGATHLFPGRAPEAGRLVADAVDAMLQAGAETPS